MESSDITLLDKKNKIVIEENKEIKGELISEIQCIDKQSFENVKEPKIIQADSKINPIQLSNNTNFEEHNQKSIELLEEKSTNILEEKIKYIY